MDAVMTFLKDPVLQYGALGLSFVLAAALVRAFASLMQQRERMQERLFEHHCERERALCDQFMACVDRNTAALEKVEQSLQRMQVQMARAEAGMPEHAMSPYE